MLFRRQHRGSERRVEEEAERPGHVHPHRLGGLLGWPAKLGELGRPVVRARVRQQFLGLLRCAAQRPLRRRHQAVVGPAGARECSGEHECPQVVRCLGSPECAVVHTLRGHGEGERVGPPDGRGNVRAAGDRVEPDRAGYPADVLRVEHVDAAELAAGGCSVVVHVGPGGRGHHGAGVAEDHAGQPARLTGARWGDDYDVFLDGQAQGVAVVRAADHDGRLRWLQHALGESE